MRSVLTTAASNVRSMAEDAMSKISAASEATSAVKADLIEAVEGIGDRFLDAKDTVVSVTSGVVSFTTSTATWLIYAGVFVASITAPIPTFIGITIFELLTISWQNKSRRISDEIDTKQQKRMAQKLIAKLAKYGKVPANATINTDRVSLVFDLESETVTGSVKTGLFSRAELSELDDATIREIMSSSEEDEAKLLEAYMTYRSVRAESERSASAR